MLWEELRQDEFNAAVEESGRVCLLPIGCVESHGIHLPLGCDVMHVLHHCKLAAEREPVVIFPPLYFGEKAGAGEYPGTIIFPEPLIHKILEQCCNEIYRNGFKKILIVNGHGGNTSLLNNFARYTLTKKTGYLCFTVSASLEKSMPKAILANLQSYPYLTEEDVGILEKYGTKRGGHGCFTETGWLFNARPDLTRLDLQNARNGSCTYRWEEFSKRSIYSPFGWMANFPDSLSADYHEGMNERIAKAMTESVVEYLADVINFLKSETISDQMYDEWAAKNPLL